MISNERLKHLQRRGAPLLLVGTEEFKSILEELQRYRQAAKAGVEEAVKQVKEAMDAQAKPAQ